MDIFWTQQCIEQYYLFKQYLSITVMQHAL